jgi:hypothetical protein
MNRREARVAHLMIIKRGWQSRIVGWAGDLTSEVSIEVSVGKTKINLGTFECVRKFINNNTQTEIKQ